MGAEAGIGVKAESEGESEGLSPPFSIKLI